MLSIIVPTLNEEDYLPLLLESIKRQDFKDYEVIISDAGSIDKTKEIAKHYECIIIEGGLPSKGRNNGAKIAKGNILFFLDADTILPDQFLTKSLYEFKLREIGVASFCFDSSSENKKFHSMLHFYNNMITTSEKILPFSAIGILIKKQLFNNINGYNENLKMAEDHDLSRRAMQYAKFGIIRSAKIIVSDRRFVKDGWFVTSVKYFLCELHTIFIGPIKSDIFGYKFNHYKDKK